MSLSHELINLLGADVAKEVLTIVASKDAMKKYLATDKGKAAKKRANQTYHEKHSRLAKFANDTKEDVVQFFNDTFMEDEMCELMKEIHDQNDANVLAFIQTNPFHYCTGTQMWKAYKEYSGSKLTRYRFITLLPQMKIMPYIVREGKKVHTPAYEIPLIDYFELCDAKSSD